MRQKLFKLLSCLWLVALVGCAAVQLPKEPATPHTRAAPAPANRLLGYDVIGVAKYCDTYLKAPKLPAVSSLLRTFGDPIPCFDKRAAMGGLTDVQVALRDATCWRNKVCPPGTPSLTDWNDMAKLAKHLNGFATRHPEITVWASPYLEHDFKDAQIIIKACNVIVQNCPTCRCVNEPMSGARNTPYPLELHGTTTSAWSVSGDGKSMFDGDNIRNDGNNFQHRTSGREQMYGWFNEMNGRVTGEDKFTPIDRRTCWPTADLMKQSHKILITEEDAIPKAPVQCKQIVRINKGAGEINKTNAEAYSPCPHSDKRGNRQLLILKRKGSVGEKIKILNSAGKEVACARGYGPYTSPGLYRYYVGNCSGETPWELYRELGSEWGFGILGGGKCLLLNSLRREGSYR